MASGLSAPHDKPYAICLVLGFSGSRPIHVVVADNAVDLETVVITVYEPDPAQWNSKFPRSKAQ